jgi:hypothetical protein
LALLPLPGCAEQALDPSKTARQLSDISLGRALLGRLQRQHELAAGLQAPVVHLGDVVTVLKPDSMIEFAAPITFVSQKATLGAFACPRVQACRLPLPRIRSSAVGRRPHGLSCRAGPE